MSRLTLKREVIRSAISKRRAPGNLTGHLVTSEYNTPSSGFDYVETRMDINFPAPTFDLNKAKLRWGGEWIRFTRGRYDCLAACGPPSYGYHTLFDSKYRVEERCELIRFLLTLELWEQTPGKKIISAQDIWLGSLREGPKYTEYIDDLFALTWRETEMESYNFVFPARFMPRWEETTDDLRLCQETTWVTEPEVLEEFRLVLRDLLEEIQDISEIILPSDDAITFERSTTTSYSYTGNVTLPQWEASLQCNQFNTKELVGLRTVVPVYPGGIRDTIIADISANNSIRWMERAMRHILEHVAESAVTLYSTTFQARLDDVVYKKGSHILRDIKKCGITYNTHDLFPVVKEELMRVIPDIRWNRYDIYSNMRIVDGDSEYIAERGYGLGMANHTVTLCNIVIHRMARNALARRSKETFLMKAVCGNDDEDVVVYGTKHHRQLANEYMEIEHDIHGALGNLINIRKSVVKPYGLFYETYNKEGWRHKEALVCNAIACAYLAPSIRVAKHYINCQSDRFNSAWARSQLRNLAEYWGDEFFDTSTEMKIHAEVGGWLDTRSYGLKTTLRDIETLERSYSTRLISFAVETCKQYMKPPSPAYKTPGIVSNFRYLGQAKRTDPKIQIYTINETDLRWYYKRLTKFQRNFSSRLEKYQTRVKQKALTSSVEKLYRKLLSREPWYAIPDSLAEEHFPPREEPLRAITEQTTHCEDIIHHMIHEAMGLQHDLVDEDRNISWNPRIPVDAMKYEVWVDIATQLYASQFSNSGFLPILEYFKRYEAYPKCTPFVGRTRVFANPHKRVKSYPAVSYFKHKVRKERIEDLPSLEDYLPIAGVDPQREGERVDLLPAIMAEYGIQIASVKPELQEDVPPPEPIPEPEVDTDRIDSILAAITSCGGLETIAYSHPDLFGESTEMDIDDFEGGGGLFGEED